MAESDYLTRVASTWAAVTAASWNELLRQQPRPTPFMRHEYLSALADSQSATPTTGWSPRIFTLWQGPALAGACVLYLKTHSRGEYVFDWAWADAYQRHGLDYYPKAVLAVPFTPVPGTRLLARDAAARRQLLDTVLAWCAEQGLSSLHLLFGAQEDLDAATAAGLLLRQNVQFHWRNAAPGPSPEAPYADFDAFLGALSQERRKKIRQERRKVAEAGVSFRWRRGRDISTDDWDFFYRCYERTYREHGNPPYLSREFFARQAQAQAESWLLFVAERAGRPMACSLIGLQEDGDAAGTVAYGRYWGALERVDCLHFEACYYQPLQWCIEHGVARFEGGAQGEHKMARALMPTATASAHWLAHPAFAEAVERFLEREGQGVAHYLSELNEHTPFKAVPVPAP